MSGARFEVGQRVYARSIGDHNCVWIFEVVKRTAKFVDLHQVGSESLRHPEGETFRVKIHNEPYCGGISNEMAWPFGHYSMAPIVRADRQVGWPAPDPADRQMKGWLVRALERVPS
jgi:hypothetical protein